MSARPETLWEYSLGSSLRFLFRSEAADQLVGFLRSRGDRAHIVAPDWVHHRVIGGKRPTGLAAASWSENVDGSISNDKSNIIAIAEQTPEEASIVAKAKHQGRQVFGLYGHVLPALLCSCNGMAAGRPIADLSRYALLCIPRSGSRYLAAVLANRGVGSPKEHIREPLAKVIAEGGLAFGSAIAALERFGQRNGIFGTKLISTFIIKASNRHLDRLEDNVAWMLDRGYRFFRLERPLNETVVSSYIAFLMKKWHFFGELDAASRAKLDTLAFEKQAALEEYIRFRAERVVLDSLAVRHGMPAISYASIVSGIDGVVAGICKHMQLDEGTLEADTARIPTPVRSESPTYSLFAERLEELLDERRGEIESRTLKKLKTLTSVGAKKAERLVADAGIDERDSG